MGALLEDGHAWAFADAGVFRRLLRSVVATGAGSCFGGFVLQPFDGAVHHLSGRRHTLTSLCAGLPVVMLTTVGARSGRPVTVPVLGIPDGRGLGVIASNWGRHRHPAWYHNLRANPEATVEARGRSVAVRARPATEEERSRLWRLGLAVYPGWRGYERRAGVRKITIFVLEPVE